jgi:hypothetical protein
MRMLPLLFLALFAISACGAVLTDPVDSVPRIGIVVSNPDAPVGYGTLTRFLIEHPGEPHPTDLTILHVTSLTEILVQDAMGALVPAGVESVMTGSTIRFWITEVERRSYPVQQRATRIIIEP